MRLREIGAVVVVASALLMAVACTPQLPGGDVPKSDAPNVVLFITDDQRVETLSVMPQMRRWFSAGTHFKPGFVTTPLCCPSRASILSGRFAHNHGVLTNVLARRLDFAHSLPAYLQRAGYRTGMTGRFLNGWSIQDPPPFFEDFVVTQRNAYLDGLYNVNGEIRQIEGYSTHVVSDHAVRFLRRGDDRPWFLMITLIAPHAPFTSERQYADEPVPAWGGNPAVSELDVRDKPPYVRSGTSGLKRRNGKRMRQLRTLMSVDDLVGRVGAEIKRLGEMENTLALFISDNGVNWGEYGLDGKGTPYRPTVEVPFFMAWPGHVAAGVDDRIAANIDIAPTVLDAAGIEPDPEVPMDGRSLLDEWRRRELLLEYYRYKPFPAPSWASLRSRTMQYTEYYDHGAVAFKELYDLSSDPWQLDNLSDKLAETDERARSLHRRLANYRSCSGVDCP